ncbi:hypothetical protein [Hungatella hathewayi]|uniref:hypothetical protein n=1 Tax=Hungatella hathewayi TaxID=154046 RepID=UPI0035679F77
MIDFVFATLEKLGLSDPLPKPESKKRGSNPKIKEFISSAFNEIDISHDLFLLQEYRILFLIFFLEQAILGKESIIVCDLLRLSIVRI